MSPDGSPARPDPAARAERIPIMHRFHAHNLFHVPKMMCDRCVASLTRALHTLDGLARVEADLAARTVRVVSRHYESALLRTLREAGFHAEPVPQPLG